MSNAITLEVFTDFVCPWCYLCTPRVEKLKQNSGVMVQWVYFPLHPSTPAEGLPLKDLFAGRGFDLEAAHARLKVLMNSEGLPFYPRSHTYNSRLAQELAKGYDGVRDALYRAYFEQGKNIGDIDVLVSIAESCGVPAENARRTLTERTFKDAVDADWQKAHQYGITGVPSFVADGQMVVGAQPYPVLERLVAAAK